MMSATSPGFREAADLADPEIGIMSPESHMWASPADYWGVLFDMTRRIKEAFDEQGIEIPLPQRVVHMSRE